MNKSTVSQFARLEQAQRKACLLNLGLACLSCGETQMVMALMKIFWREGLQHA
jgi:hypothetical protein